MNFLGLFRERWGFVLFDLLWAKKGKGKTWRAKKGKGKALEDKREKAKAPTQNFIQIPLYNHAKKPRPGFLPSIPFLRKFSGRAGNQGVS